MFQYPGLMRKNFIPGNFSWRVVAETWDASCFKKGLLEKQEYSKHLHHIAIEKDILSELNRCIFQIPLKYIKLVIPKMLFILVLWVLIFTSKLRDLPQQYNPPSKIKISDLPPLPQAKTFSEISQAGGRVHHLLNSNLIYKTLLTGAGSGLLILMLEKLNLFCLTCLITLVLLMWKLTGLFLRKNHLLKYWSWLSLQNWIQALTFSLF